MYSAQVCSLPVKLGIATSDVAVSTNRSRLTESATADIILDRFMT